MTRSTENFTNRNGVLKYAVGGTDNGYEDKKMLEYLSVASSKIRFLAFYNKQEFVGAIEIAYVISGIAKK